jgi:polyhydroxyalkanoate synthesis regulator phasin
MNSNDPTKDLTEPLEQPEETTKDLSTDELLKLILSRLDALESSQGDLKTLLTERLQDTRPIWQAMEAKLDRLIEDVAINGKRLDALTLNTSRQAAEHQLLIERVTDSDPVRIHRLIGDLEILNEKFDAQAEEVRFLRKSVRDLEDKANRVTM